MDLSERLYNLKRNDVHGALVLYREGARSPDQIDWMLRLQDDPLAFAKTLESVRTDYDDDQPRDERGQFAAVGGGASAAAHKVARELLQQSGGSMHASLSPFHGEHVPEHLIGEDGEVPTGEVHAALQSYRPSPPVKEREYVTVHHSTTPEAAALLLRQGVIPEAKPTNLARERFENGEPATFGPGNGLSGGIYVGAPGTTDGFGRATVEMKVPKEWLGIPPELHGIENDPMRALHTEHGALVTRAIHPSLIRKVENPKLREAEITKGNIGIPREQMPQIAEKDVPEFLDGLRERGIAVHSHDETVSSLKPTQSTMNMEKVDSMTRNMPPHILAKPVVVSNDKHILDGHHRWAALHLNNPHAKIAVHLVDLPIRQLVTEALAFPKAGRRTVKDGSDDEPRDEHGQWTSVGGSGTGKLKTSKATEGGTTFETGKPITMSFVRNTEKSPKSTDNKFGQDIEPHGRYMLHDVNPKGDAPKGWEKGTVHFKNPLVIPLSEDPDAIYGPKGWKAQLHNATGLKGKSLSEHLAKQGHDAIITTDKYGTSEIVDLTSFHKGSSDDHGYHGENLTETERKNPDFVVDRIAKAKAGGWMRVHSKTKGFLDVAQQAPEGAPRFPPGNAERGTLMYRDGDRRKPVMIGRARATGPNGEKMAIVHNVVPRVVEGQKDWGLEGHYHIERTRLQHGGRNILERKNRPSAKDILPED